MSKWPEKKAASCGNGDLCGMATRCDSRLSDAARLRDVGGFTDVQVEVRSGLAHEARLNMEREAAAGLKHLKRTSLTNSKRLGNWGLYTKSFSGKKKTKKKKHKKKHAKQIKTQLLCVCGKAVLACCWASPQKKMQGPLADAPDAKKKGITRTSSDPLETCF